ncbi:MAG: dihydropteroate synthase [Alphaproteobacteria bacterium]|nr:MAG: dihydropteroate synthase [Alphaproteobacteria bacterium]
MTDPARPTEALRLAGGWCWFDRLEHLRRGAPPEVIPAAAAPAELLERLTAPRAPLAGLDLSRPRVMAILNVTPDSFSDGGRFAAREAAVAQGLKLAEEGADIIDIGGESTRPGAHTVPEEEEISRVVPVISELAPRIAAPISIDTRKASVAAAAIAAGAAILNDVAALGFDPALGPLAARSGVPVVLMHAQGDPKTMQADPRYGDVLLDVYDFLEARIAAAEALGIPRTRIIVDPGIGFGKTIEHNLALLRRLSLFHALGCPLLLGASRKRFIGVIGRAPETGERLPGSLAVALAALRQGVQIVRVHDSLATLQALRLEHALITGDAAGRR